MVETEQNLSPLNRGINTGRLRRPRNLPPVNARGAPREETNKNKISKLQKQEKSGCGKF